MFFSYFQQSIDDLCDFFWSVESIIKVCADFWSHDLLSIISFYCHLLNPVTEFLTKSESFLDINIQ